MLTVTFTVYVPATRTGSLMTVLNIEESVSILVRDAPAQMTTSARTVKNMLLLMKIISPAPVMTDGEEKDVLCI